MFALKFHLKSDINEYSFTDSRSGKDLHKDSYYHSFLSFMFLFFTYSFVIEKKNILNTIISFHEYKNNDNIYQAVFIDTIVRN